MRKLYKGKVKVKFLNLFRKMRKGLFSIQLPISEQSLTIISYLS